MTEDEATDALTPSAREDRVAILKRRATLVASALAGLSLGTSCSGPEVNPYPCLEPLTPHTGDETAPPSPTASSAPPALPAPSTSAASAPR
jgi:hypothetical protein